MSAKVGEKAPYFKLFSSEKQQVSLEDFSGKNVVVLFFPLAFTGVCTAELCATRDDLSSYESLNAQVLAISVDSPFSLAKFKEEQSLNFPLLSDFNGTTSAAYDSLYEEFTMGMKNVSKRSAFVIDGKGMVRHAEILESAGDMPNFVAVKQALAAL